MDIKFLLRGIQIPFLLSCIFFFSGLKAQNRTFIHHTTRDGLVSGYVWDMMQDSKGYVWIATSSGLSRFDGYGFTNYVPKPNNSASISGQYIRSVRELDSGRLLVASSAGLDVFCAEKEVFKKIIVPSSLPELISLVDVAVLKNGDIWAAASHGLYFIPGQDLDADTVDVRYFYIKNDSTENQAVLFFSMKADGDSSLWIGSETYLHQFDLKGERFVDLGAFDPDVEKVLQGRIWEIHKASNGDLLLSSTTGLVRWKAGEKDPEAVKTLGPYTEQQITEAGFQSITEDPEGRIWLGTGILGALRWDLETNETEIYRHDPADQNSINSDDIHFAFTDDQQNTWFGYHVMGISMMYSLNWKYTYKLTMESAGAEDPVNDLNWYAEDDEGNLYFATPGGLVFNPGNGGQNILYTLPPGMKSDGGFNLPLIREDHMLLISYNGNRIYTFHPDTKRFRDITSGDNLGIIPFPPVETASHLYFSSLTGNIVVLEKADYSVSLIEIPHENVVEGDIRPTAIMEDSEGNYLAQRIFLRPGNFEPKNFLFDPASNALTAVDLSLPENISSIFAPHVSQNEPGVIWQRLNSGILKQNLLTGETELLFQTDAGLLNEGSGLILEDRDGYLWMNNQTGIMKLDPVTQSISNYVISQDARKVWLDWVDELKNGDIIFMGKGGYIRFNPDELEQENPVQKLYVTELIIGDRKFEGLNDHSVIRISHADNNLAFSYIGLNYPDPVYTRYRYRLEGYDNDWNMVGTQRRIFLANLPPGKYAFQVQAATRFGPFTENTATVDFIVLPPWWRTLPAYILYGLILVGGIFGFDRIQRKRLITRERERAREKELEQAREIEKAYHELKTTQSQLIQSEKMASLGELTAGIAHEIQNPLNFVNNFSEVNVELLNELKVGPLTKLPDSEKKEAQDLVDNLGQNLEKISFHGRRADSIVKNMLLHSRSSAGTREPADINALADEYLRLSYHGMRARDKSFNAKYSLDVDHNLPEIKVITQDISRVMLNMMNNAFYAVMNRSKEGIPGYVPEVVVSTKKCNDGIEIRVKDNGPGIPEPIRDKIFQPFFTTKPAGEGTGLGLSISYDIITKGHGGDMKVFSIADEDRTGRETGTEFVIYLPIKTT
jgi:signal transduction histidine kinase/ligand-binding sensor domain-containing protein